MQLKPPIEIEDIELIPVGDRKGFETPPAGLSLARLKDWAAEYRWLVAVVIVPTLLSAMYFSLFAADRYESESRFVVRSPASSGAGALSSLIQGGMPFRSADDAFIVHAFIRSRDAVRALVEEAGLLERLARPEADFLWRYPPLLRAQSQERLYEHFKSFVSIDYDQSTGISTLKVQAFRPGDAQEIAEMLLSKSEALINRLSARSEGDAVATATREVDEARQKAREALDRITAFRRQNAIIDPGRVSSAALQTITSLALEVAQLNAQLNELNQASPDSPQAITIKQRVAALEAQMKQEREALAGADTSLAPLIAEYERLSLEREFAERTFASVQSALDLARIEAQRQRLFLERISSPALADYPRYPSRLFNVLGTLVFSFMLYAIGARLAADTRSHAGN